MALSGEQKQYIKKHVWQFSPAQIADALGLSEREIHDYLKKRWRPEKYQKYLSRLNMQENPTLQSFSLKRFFFENHRIILLLTALVFVTYANSLRNGFVSDDIPAFPDNPDLGSVHYIFSNGLIGLITRLLYFVTYRVGGLNVFLFRLPDLFFHLGAVLAAFLILSLVAKKPWAVMAAALFAVHPMLSESVTWISGGPYALFSSLFLVSLAAYILSDQNRKYYYISLVAFFLAVTLSEKATVLALIFPLYEIAFGSLRKKWKKYWPYLGISFVFGIYFLSKISQRVSVLATNYYLAPGKDSLLIKIPTSVYSYFRIIFWPDNFSLYHTEMVFTRTQYYGTVLVFLAYLALIIFAFYKKNKAIAFWLTFFIIPLLPTLSPLRVAWTVAERYAYLSTLGILATVAWVFYKISSYEKLKIPVYTIFSIILIALSVRTIVRNSDWKNEETLWIATEKTSPSGPNIHNNMGAVYQQKNQYDKAIAEFNLAIEINPQYADAYHNLANTYLQMGQFNEAIKNFQKAVELNPLLWQSHQSLAMIYYNQGAYSLADDELKKALEINPTDPQLRQNLDLLEKNMKNPPETDQPPTP